MKVPDGLVVEIGTIPVPDSISYTARAVPHAEVIVSVVPAMDPVQPVLTVDPGVSATVSVVKF